MPAPTSPDVPTTTLTSGRIERTAARFSHAVARLDSFLRQKVCDEVADEVVAHGVEERGAKPHAARADADVRRAAADVCGEALDLGEGRADLVRVEVNRAAPHGQQVEPALHHHLFSQG